MRLSVYSLNLACVFVIGPPVSCPGPSATLGSSRGADRLTPAVRPPRGPPVGEPACAAAALLGLRACSRRCIQLVRKGKDPALEPGAKPTGGQGRPSPPAVLAAPKGGHHRGPLGRPLAAL